MRPVSTAQKMYFTLRLATAMCFIGHGAFGIITKPIWYNYFGVFGIGHDVASQLMPLVGVLDIIMGIIFLVYPVRIIAVWLVIWSIITAALRPLSGEPFAELIERAGNYGAPLALLLLSPVIQSKWLDFQKIPIPTSLPAERLQKVQMVLRIAAFLLLAGHGWLNLIGKKGLIDQYTSLGFTDSHQIAMIAGMIEILGALSIIIKPISSILVFFIIWKMATELFYPHYEIFEWVERGGSYGVLLALWFSLQHKKAMMTES